MADTLRDIGAQMANVMFNLAQRPGDALTGDHVATMDSLRKQWDAAIASRPAEVDDEAVSILRTILTGDVGRQTLGKLARGQSTETEDGKAWLAAQRLVEQYRQGQRDAVAADRARRGGKS